MRLFGDLREFTRRLANGVAEVVELEVACVVVVSAVVVVVIVACFVVCLALVGLAVVASWRKLRPLTAVFFDPCWKSRWRRRRRLSQLVAFPQICDADAAADVSGDALGSSSLGSGSSGR